MKKSISLPSSLLLAMALLACAPGSYAKEKKDDHPKKTALDQIMETGPTITSSVITPLGDKHLKETSANITTLREKLLDEGAKSPAASPETYQAAAALCDAWLSAMDDRHNIWVASAKTHAMNKADAKETDFFDDAEKKQWLDHAAKWHIYLDQLYARVGTFRREPMHPMATPAPAATAAPAAPAAAPTP